MDLVTAMENRIYELRDEQRKLERININISIKNTLNELAKDIKFREQLLKNFLDKLQGVDANDG